jgi:hypothetical protein
MFSTRKERSQGLLEISKNSITPSTSWTSQEMDDTHGISGPLFHLFPLF